jgi:hypothetical protein
MKKAFRSLLVTGLMLGFQLTLSAQFFRVYQYTTADANEKELVYWISYIPSSDHSYPFFGDTVDRKGLLAHSVELEYGITNKLTVGLYADFEQPRGESLRYIRAKAVMLYYSLFVKNQMPVDLALYAEYKLPRKGYGNSEEIEFKLIIEKEFGFHRIDLNPTFEKKISGEDVGEGVEFSLCGSYVCTKSPVFQPRLEYYSKYGELYDIPGFDEQEHYIFPSFDLYFGKYYQFCWHAGVGFGLTGTTDNIVIKSILSWGFF